MGINKSVVETILLEDEILRKQLTPETGLFSAIDLRLIAKIADDFANLLEKDQTFSRTVVYKALSEETAMSIILNKLVEKLE